MGFASSLRGVNYVELTWDSWKLAARFARKLAAVGHRLPLTDLVLAAAALDAACLIYTTDPHFDLIPDLKRFVPNAKA